MKVLASTKTGFTKLSGPATGITFTNLLSDTKAAENQIRLSGSGVALGDIDGDGWCDLYLCRMEGANALYRNLGDWRFQDLTVAAGVACPDQWSTAAALADLDGDGNLDLLVNALGGGTRLFFNDGKGHFTEAADSGLVRRHGAMSLALADVDGDGDLDLYVANYRTTTVRSTGLEMLNINGRRMLKPEDRDQMYITPSGFLREHGEVDILYLNDGKGHFTARPWTGGAFLDEDGKPLNGPPRDWGFSVMMRDMNGDGAPDIYVCNDFWTPDRFWLNDGQGHFRALARLALPCTSSFSMGVDFADLNRDGFDDFFVLDMQSPDPVRRMTQAARDEPPASTIGLPAERPQIERNTLLVNRGDGTYAEIAEFSGVPGTEWSWCPMFLDVDLDGYEDLLITCGYGFDTQDRDADNQITRMGPWPRAKVPFKLLQYPRLPLPCVAFRNRGDLTFTDVSAAWGFNTVGYSQGMAAGDLDNDGDLDVVVNHLNAEAGLYRNDAAAARVAVRLKGAASNTRGIGAKVKVTGGPVPQSQEIICGGRFLSSDDAARMFAAGSPTNRLTLEVTWRSGKTSMVRDALPNHIYELDEAQATETEHGARSAGPQPSTINHQPFFQDVSALLHHTHSEAAFDDFARQPLLAVRLSQLGPGVCWFDFDADGWDDLVIGSGRGGQLAVYRNDGRGGFARWQEAPVTQPVTRDQMSVLAFRKPDGQPILLAGSANYEDGLAKGSPVRGYDLAHKTILDELPGQPSSTGPLALGDGDGDGDLDLFVGGRVVPGRYPEAASSLLCLNESGTFRVDEQRSKFFAQVGLVSGALWTDLNGDGWPDLVLACEWGPLKLFLNEAGKLRPWDAPLTWPGSGSIDHQPLTISLLTGWWTSVTAGDFDGDGQLDLVAGNWGRNTKYEPQANHPLRVYYGDLDGSGTVELVEAYYHAESRRTLPWRDLDTLTLGLPWLRERFPTYLAYGQADVAAVLGDQKGAVKEWSVRTLSTMVFLNRGDRFEPRTLPFEAQVSPVFGLSVADFDGDGDEDIFLNQNFLAVEPLSAPYASGLGVVLKGDGQGNFAAMSARASGVRVSGDGRGAGVCDYDGDGRVDLVAAQNGGETKLYRNVSAQPGLRVRLSGPAENPTAVGATLRLFANGRLGPAREVHAGGGYWSQDSAVQVLSLSVPPEQIWVRWPGGKVTQGAMPQAAKEVQVNSSGQVRLLR